MPEHAASYRGLQPLVSILFLVLGGCSSGSDPGSTQGTGPFTVTNVALGNGRSEWIIRYTNGLSVVAEDRRVTLYFQTDSSLAVTFDPRTMRCGPILLETPSSGQAPGAWITDFNADGTPDVRRVKGVNVNEVFYEGRWLQSAPGPATNVSVKLHGTNATLFFDGTRWRRPVSTTMTESYNQNEAER